MTQRLILVGAGDLAKEVYSWMLCDGTPFCADTKPCFIDDKVSDLRIGDTELAYLGSASNFYPEEGDEFIATIASPELRSNIVEKLLACGCEFKSYIHPSAQVSRGSRLGKGCIMLPYSLASNDSVIGDFSIINCHSSIGHNVSMESFVTVSSHVDIMGHCIIEKKVFMGSGSRVFPGKRIGESALIGAGAIASRSIPPGRTLYAPMSKVL